MRIKAKKKTSPTKRSLDLLRERGMHVQVVEKWNPFAKQRVDLFKWIDIVAVDRFAILGVQTTTKAHMGERLEKAKGNQALIDWIRSGGRLELHGWRKLKTGWEADVRRIHLDDLTLGLAE